MDRLTKTILLSGSILCGLGVIIGAFGAHALKETLLANNRLSAFETGVDYHFYHGLAILVVGLLHKTMNEPRLKVTFGLFLIGILLFSGSLYLIGTTDWVFLGPVTPIGGVFFIGGWVHLGWIIKSKA